MSSRPVSLLGHNHVCPIPGHGGGPVVRTGQSYVTVDGVPIATVTDDCLCTGVPTTDAVTGGSAIANIDGKRIARIGDSSGHGGNLVQGVPWITFE